ncbi:SPP1 family predicted phage head-tail adaptor [Acidovorax delafieldii]|uniref:SPP1 family predicted phage head-tail adaptor n=1 Tax=Acidovorax delafieldii TaxID=47920 RepID=A0AAJ2BY92_ACIDE|nr:phage head closure protein [Acidovorax delafieldii]MDR6767724.1 SPP1 family predicted phage head-tail adaptor [Acidovorax delafieldii]MDR6839706.1 SPP1 family predicted phage head-tail adaptor [Acidovorax delafieldii]MDR7368393.1 SPP1 family predicted phage head-tail adaptor [Acidovorax delafieldii]
MRAGDLRNRITIERQTTDQDAGGQPLEVWTPMATVWADIRNPTGLGAIRADAQAAVVKTSIRIRWRTDIEAGMRVVHGATVYEIGAVLPDHARREFVDLVCGGAK